MHACTCFTLDHTRVTHGSSQVCSSQGSAGSRSPVWEALSADQGCCKPPVKLSLGCRFTVGKLGKIQASSPTWKMRAQVSHPGWLQENERSLSGKVQGENWVCSSFQRVFVGPVTPFLPWRGLFQEWPTASTRIFQTLYLTSPTSFCSFLNSSSI